MSTDTIQELKNLMTAEEKQELEKIRDHTFKIKMEFELNDNDFEKLVNILKDNNIHHKGCNAVLSEPTVR